MTVKPLDVLLALKAVSLAPGLTESDRRVAATLLEHFNRNTRECDPGLERIAILLCISTRTVIRATQRLEKAGLFRKDRHGGHLNRNSYEPVWQKFREIESAWRARFSESARSRRSQLSPSSRQDCHLKDDSDVTQTYRSNLLKETYSKSPPRKERGGELSSTPVPRIAKGDIRYADVVRTEAERRWTTAVHKWFASLPVTYAEIIVAIDPVMQEAATDAEICRRGAGLAHILRELRIPDVLTQPDREAISTKTPNGSSAAGADSAPVSKHGIPEGKTE